jgi:RHS repeat-associated protein
VQAYSYDFANRLTGVTQGTNSFAFSYDGLDNRYRQTVNGQTTNYTLDLAGGLSQVLYDGTSSYYYGLGQISQQKNGVTETFLPDGLGSVRQLANQNGSLSFGQAFDQFGNSIGQSGQGSSSYGYAGEWTDGTGLQILRARYYSPAQGRFLTKDSFSGFQNQPSTLNPYAYTTNNPVNSSDPSGHCSLSGSGDLAWLQSCIDDITKGVQEYKEGASFGHALFTGVGGERAFVDAANSVGQYNCDISIVLSDIPIEQRLPAITRVAQAIILSMLEMERQLAVHGNFYPKFENRRFTKSSNKDSQMSCQCNEITEMDGRKAQDYAEEHLRKVRIGNWETEFECPDTGIHWLMDYPHSELMGGGPPRLRKLPISPNVCQDAG